MDYTRKPKIILCENCHRKTPHHIETDKKDKVTFLKCDICGNWKTFCYWS